MAGTTPTLVIASLLLLAGAVRAATGSAAIYINCGGPEVEFNGVTWSSDDSLALGGETYLQGNSSVIYGTEGDGTAIFRSARYFGPATPGVNTYSLSVETAGYYIVRLYFAEILYQTPTARMFSVWIQDRNALQNFTIEKVESAIVKEFHVPILQGTLNISLVRGPVGDPIVSAISVEPAEKLYPWLDLNTNGTVFWERELGLNCGTDETYWPDSMGRMWTSDLQYFDTTTEVADFRNYPVDDKVVISGTEKAPEYLPTLMYHSMRRSYATQLVEAYASLLYALPAIPNTMYRLRLHFALIDFANNTPITVVVNNVTFLDSFDITEYGDMKAFVLDVAITPTIEELSVLVTTPADFFSRAFLNGLEMFRTLAILDGTQQVYPIAGTPPPAAIPQTPSEVGAQKGSRDKWAAWEGAAIGAASTLVLVALAALIMLKFWKPKAVKGADLEANGGIWKGQFHEDYEKAGEFGHEVGHASRFSGSLGAKSFTFKELKQATNNFSVENVVGKGGFGMVYKASLSNGTDVAVKRLSLESEQGEKEFLTEVELLSRLHHRNLVNLIGYCEEDKQLMLVYEFVPNGTLREYLADEEKANALGWAARLRILLGAARGVEYLHQGATPPVIHRDLKTSNILLESCLDAKVADFGLSKLGKDIMKPEITHISTAVRGTMGYLDPQYFKTRRLTEKSDVYSFGVVLLEVVTGRLPIWLEAAARESPADESSTFNEPLFESTDGQDRINVLVEWALPLFKSNQAMKAAAPQLQNLPAHLLPSFKAVTELATLCVETQPKDRPTMSEVVRALEAASATVGRSVFSGAKAKAGLPPMPETLA